MRSEFNVQSLLAKVDLAKLREEAKCSGKDSSLLTIEGHTYKLCFLNDENIRLTPEFSAIPQQASVSTHTGEKDPPVLSAKAFFAKHHQGITTSTDDFSARAQRLMQQFDMSPKQTKDEQSSHSDHKSLHFPAPLADSLTLGSSTGDTRPARPKSSWRASLGLHSEDATVRKQQTTLPNIPLSVQDPAHRKSIEKALLQLKNLAKNQKRLNTMFIKHLTKPPTEIPMDFNAKLANYLGIPPPLPISISSAQYQTLRKHVFSVLPKLAQLSQSNFATLMNEAYELVLNSQPEDWRPETDEQWQQLPENQQNSQRLGQKLTEIITKLNKFSSDTLSRKTHRDNHPFQCYSDDHYTKTVMFFIYQTEVVTNPRCWITQDPEQALCWQEPTKGLEPPIIHSTKKTSVHFNEQRQEHPDEGNSDFFSWLVGEESYYHKLEQLAAKTGGVPTKGSRGIPLKVMTLRELNELRAQCLTHQSLKKTCLKEPYLEQPG